MHIRLSFVSAAILGAALLGACAQLPERIERAANGPRYAVDEIGRAHV